MKIIDKEKVIITLNQFYDGEVDVTNETDEDILVIYHNSGLFHEHYGEDAQIEEYTLSKE